MCVCVCVPRRHVSRVPVRAIHYTFSMSNSLLSKCPRHVIAIFFTDVPQCEINE